MSLSWTQGVIATNGINVNYYRTGGDKPAILLAHGATDDGMCWIRFAQAIEADYDVIMVDARGHGLSGKPKSRYTHAEHAADLLGVINALGIDKPILVGHSMGAFSVATTAALYPDKVSKLVLEDPSWSELYNETEQERQDRLQLIEQWKISIHEMNQKPVDQLENESRIYNPTWDDVEHRPWAEAKKNVYANMMEFAENPRDWRPDVEAIQCPTLLITADNSKGAIVTPDVANIVANKNSLFRIANINSAGHNVRRESFQMFLDTVRGFLGIGIQVP